MTTEPSLRVASLVESTRAEGPGVRFAVWVQGCALQCDGCFNPHMWSARGGTPTDPAELASRILETQVDGITLLGGEPFEQASPLARLAGLVRRGGRSVMTFTGHLREELERSTDRGVGALLDETDLLVDGPYDASSPDLLRPWVGSTNQRFHFLTERYRHLEQQLVTMPDRVELRVAASGEVQINGWATVDMLDELLADTTPTIGRGQVR